MVGRALLVARTACMAARTRLRAARHAAFTAVVEPLKIASDVHCPWNLQEFCGVAQLHEPFIGDSQPVTHKHGRCWPGGHASTGFCLFALFFALRDRRPKWARWMLATALALGAVCSAGRMAQGTYFLSLLIV